MIAKLSQFLPKYLRPPLLALGKAETRDIASTLRIFHQALPDIRTKRLLFQRTCQRLSLVPLVVQSALVEQLITCNCFHLRNVYNVHSLERVAAQLDKIRNQLADLSAGVKFKEHPVLVAAIHRFLQLRLEQLPEDLRREEQIELGSIVVMEGSTSGL